LNFSQGLVRSDAKLFTIRLEVFKVISINIEYIILITDSLGFVRKVVDFLVYFGQTYSLATVLYLDHSFIVGLAIELNSKTI